MGSIEEAKPPVIGEYMLPIITPSTSNGDPWQRNYFAPPQHLDLVKRKYPLIDLRPILSQPDYTPESLLKSHGFGIVHHTSNFLSRLNQDSEETIPEEALATEYYPEIEELVLQTTGAKKIFILASALRQGKSIPTEYISPTGLGKVSDATSATGKHKLSSQKKLALAAPVRKPHMDFTPLGARQEIRSKSQEIFDAARESGVIEYEDQICEASKLEAATKDADDRIRRQYNTNGKLGPRYAAYSIWRPLKPVQRDPLTLSPRPQEDKSEPGPDGVYWPYENRIPGYKGDYLKEYAMLGTKTREQQEGDQMKWYYVPKQRPEEVLFIKLFDSASLGEGSEHASAPWHASPEIGSVEGEEPRESIDVRVLAFW
ncbi:Gibberellin cluster GA4 desaturase [Pseudocercospora fuligena]|uniref:Gibberellin cluster GA4 desaturase n=1 Tax=Pseudocercospora fuligena TaxID=685502 RepID=A0A8H6VIP0_9PEZI|nr:Gibberellin cluster GA4 desaturase [Pseudocercospora fuligena]